MEKQDTFLFGKRNYLLMVLGIVLIALGYMLMAGGGSDDPEVFNPEIFSSRRIFWAPLIVILGFAVEVVAILIKPKKD